MIPPRLARSVTILAPLVIGSPAVACERSLMATKLGCLLALTILGACDAQAPRVAESTSAVDITCAAGCGGVLTKQTLPGPHGAVTLTAYSNSPNLGDGYVDCDSGPSDCHAGAHTAANGATAYGCTWQCVEIVNRYNASVWGAPEIYANAGPTFCATAASSSLPQYYVYGQSGVATSGHAPVAGDTLVWNGHVAIATSSVSPGVAGTINVITENATCSGTDSVSWNGSMFGAKYGLGALCWVHETANMGVVSNDPCRGASYGTGDYCGGALPGGDANALYSCSNGATANKQSCPCGCQTNPPKTNDTCAACPVDLSTLPSTDGGLPDNLLTSPPIKPHAHGCSAAPTTASATSAACLWIPFALLWLRRMRRS
jgi:hypothetical protein